VEAVELAHQWMTQQAEMPHWPGDISPEEMLAGFVLTMVRRMKLGDRDKWQNRLMLSHKPEALARKG
jgi:hypothetical protein